jgi:hypothetical protein
MGAVLRSPSSPGIVGRAAELGQLRSALAAARSAQPVTVLVGGEAGVGKTRLVAEFVAEATDASALVIVGQSVDIGGDGLPFGPVIGAVRDLVGQLGADVILEHAGPGREALAGLLPELGLAAGPPDGARGRLFEVVTGCSNGPQPNAPRCWSSRICIGPTVPRAPAPLRGDTAATPQAVEPPAS